jgi:hemolysin-activating ACP:hemolysin acyltransferase
MRRSWSPLDSGMVFAIDGKPDGSGGAGSPAPAAGAIDTDEMRRRAAFSRDVSASFGQLVSLMMRQRQYKHAMLAELEWLVVPALATRQFRVVEGVSQDRGLVAPIAAVLWASVSPEVDKRLTENLELPFKLKPEEWRSGPNVWIIETLGEPKAVTMTLQHLMQNDLKGKTVRMRVRGQDGKITVGRVELQPDAVPEPAKV